MLGLVASGPPPGTSVERMGLDVAFFRAAGDAEAAVAEARPGGPLGWPQVVGTRRRALFHRQPVVQELGPAYDGFARRGYDPMVNMGTLEELLTGRAYDEITEDPRWGHAVSDEELPGAVLALTDTLQQALAHATDARLRDVAAPWSRTEELMLPGWQDVSVQEHAEFLRRLRDLAAAASRDGQRLYCYFSTE